MKLLLQLAVIAAFATPVLAHAAGDISKPSKNEMTVAKKKKKKKSSSTGSGDAAAPTEGGK